MARAPTAPYGGQDNFHRPNTLGPLQWCHTLFDYRRGLFVMLLYCAVLGVLCFSIFYIFRGADSTMLHTRPAARWFYLSDVVLGSRFNRQLLWLRSPQGFNQLFLRVLSSVLALPASCALWLSHPALCTPTASSRSPPSGEPALRSSGVSGPPLPSVRRHTPPRRFHRKHQPPSPSLPAYSTKTLAKTRSTPISAFVSSFNYRAQHY